MDSQYDRVAILEAQMQKLQEKVVSNTSSQVKLQHLQGVQDREKEEWRESRKFLEEQLSAARQECQSLRREARNGLRGESEEAPPISGLHRSLSSQSLPVHTSIREKTGSPCSTCPSPPSSLYNYPLYSQMKPISGSSYAIPLANSTLLGHSHISGSNSSISSTKSANPTLGHTHSTRDHGNYASSRHKLPSDSLTQQHFHIPFSSTPRYPSSSERDLAGRGKPAGSKYYLHSTRTHSAQSHLGPTRQGALTTSATDLKGGPLGHRRLTPSSSGKNASTLTPPDVELQRSKLKIKQLEKEVFLLDDQLSDNGRSAQGHVEELVLLRTELAQEKASLAIVRQEIRDQAAREVGVVRTLHERQVKELEGKLKKGKMERGRLERDGVGVRTKLNGTEAECERLHEQVLVLERQLEGEKVGHARSMGKLQGEVEGAHTHVAKLEATLQKCRAQQYGHVTKAEEDSTKHTMLMRQLEVVSQELRQKDKELGRKVEQEVHLQQELVSVKAELQQCHTSWQEVKGELKERLLRSEASREALLKQLAEASRKLTLHSAQLGGKREVLGELEKYRKEVRRLEGVVSAEIAERGRMEVDVRRWRREKEKLERRCKEEATRHEVSEKMWQDERRAKEACEVEGEELRKEVGRLSEELLLNQHQLQGEVDGKADKERSMEESLSHLQQELAKRAQQVLEMDRLLQSHQAETTGRRLQLERTLTQRQGEVSARTQEVEELRMRAKECETTIEELRGKLLQAKQDQKNLFSGSQAQLLTQNSKVTELEGKLEDVGSAQDKVSKEAGTLREELAEVRQKERAWHEQCQQLQGKVKVLTEERGALHAKHLSEVQQLQEMHVSQLTSREQQADSHRHQLQKVTLQEKVKQEELSRYRVQVTSLAAELAAERRVSEESRQQVATGRAEVNKYRAQVANLQTSISMLQEMFEHQSMGIETTPHTPGKAVNGIPKVAMAMNSLSYSENDVDFVMLPSHLKTTPTNFQATPTKLQTVPTGPLTPSTGNASPVTTPTSSSERGSIISV